ncbi:MAG: hypothetical protein J07HX64_01120 [halophilic archaeon J07HX64]|nr:MAG: hypothetical protein J07HX64_01120 [halophilic archaeon J07HX64]
MTLRRTQTEFSLHAYGVDTTLHSHLWRAVVGVVGTNRRERGRR